MTDLYSAFSSEDTEALFEIFVVKWPKFRPKVSDFGGSPEGTSPKRGEDLSGTDVHRRAKFHADRCHRR